MVVVTQLVTQGLRGLRVRQLPQCLLIMQALPLCGGGWFGMPTGQGLSARSSGLDRRTPPLSRTTAFRPVPADSSCAYLAFPTVLSAVVWRDLSGFVLSQFDQPGAQGPENLINGPLCGQPERVNGRALDVVPFPGFALTEQP